MKRFLGILVMAILAGTLLTTGVFGSNVGIRPAPSSEIAWNPPQEVIDAADRLVEAGLLTQEECTFIKTGDASGYQGGSVYEMDGCVICAYVIYLLGKMAYELSLNPEIQHQLIAAIEELYRWLREQGYSPNGPGGANPSIWPEVPGVGTICPRPEI
jgi:hypothetical protein